MVLVAIAWLYVALMMAVAEATHAQGSVLGAVFTFLIYGMLPLALVLYVMATPARRALRRAAEGASALQPDAGGEPAGDALAPKREES